MTEKLRAALAMVEKRVTSATQSPMNALRWSCELECGHEAWVTRTRKPKRAACGICGREPLRPSK